MKRQMLFRVSAAVLVAFLTAQAALAGGKIQDIVPLQFGTFGDVDYVEYEARFRGSTTDGAYDVPCLVVEPINREDGNGTVLLELVNTAGVSLPGGGEVAFGRFQLTDEMLFGRGFSYAAVRWSKGALGSIWPPIDFSHTPGPPTTGDRIDGPATDAFDIIVDFANEIRASGIGNRVYSYGYSNSASIQRGLLAGDSTQGSFDFSLVGARGGGIILNKGMFLIPRFDASPPPATAGKVIAFHTETEVSDIGQQGLGRFDAWELRAETANFRTYEMAGTAHGSRPVAEVFGFPEAESANPFMGNEVVRALFIAGHFWTTEGTEPPASAWFGPPGDKTIDRDENGNGTISSERLALLPEWVNGPIRLPDVELGRGTYLGLDPSFFALFLDCNAATCDSLTERVLWFRAISGRFLDLEFVPLHDGSPRFNSHGDYVNRAAAHAATLVEQGYLLPEDAAAIADEAARSDVGKGVP